MAEAGRDCLFFVQSLPASVLPREPNPISNAVGYAKFFSRSHDAVIRVYDEAGNVIVTYASRQPPFALTI
jgi:hypothetical protein